VLKTEYRAFLFELEGRHRYALYRVEPSTSSCGSYLFNPKCDAGASHAGRLNGCVKNAWGVRARVRIDVLVGNHSAIEFWRSVGFTDYCLTMERPV